MQSLLILGRQPHIGLAELESLYGATKIIPLSHGGALVDVDPCLLAFDRLGGSIKFCKVLAKLDYAGWDKIEDYLINQSPLHATAMPEGKMYLGVSAYNFDINPKTVFKTAVKIKQAIRAKTGRGVRVIPNVSLDLSSAQVIHNRLTLTNGWELVIFKDKQSTIIAQTVKVQNITAYARRDQARPFRDSKIGMLPPKLAQIIINLASGPLPPEAALSVCDIPPDQSIPKNYFVGSLLLDPFCGSGVIIQEAMIMGYNCLGSDINPRMIDYTKRNIDWLRNQPKSPLPPAATLQLEVADATNHNWEGRLSMIASETYLGRPLSKAPVQSSDIRQQIEECNRIVKQFLENLAPQINSKTRLCIGVPSWQLADGSFYHLPVLDSLETIGYNRLSFQHSGADDQLIYFRKNQIVARELLVLIRK